MNARVETAMTAAPPRMGTLARLPVFFALTGKRAVVAGGSAAAAWKVELLLACGARVEVFAGAPCEELLALADAPPGGDIRIAQRGWAAGDLTGAALAIGAFDNDDDAGAFATAARGAGVPVNVIDKPAFCDFSFGSIVNRSPLVIGISTDGAAPVFAQAVRGRIEALLPQGFARWAAAALLWRGLLKATELSFAGRRKFWQFFTAQAMNDPAHAPSSRDFARLVAEVEALGATVEQGTITLVDAGPGDPELLTLRAVRALQSADAILFDETVPTAMLDFARREASRLPLPAGVEPAALTLDLARRGKRVVCLMRSEAAALSDADVAACAADGIAIAHVPGVTVAPPAKHGWRLRVVRQASR